MLAAAYGFVNENAKFQVQSDKALTDLDFVSASMIPPLFLLHREGTLSVMLTKIVDDLLQAGCPSQTDQIVYAFKNRLNLGTIIHNSCHI